MMDYASSIGIYIDIPDRPKVLMKQLEWEGCYTREDIKKLEAYRIKFDGGKTIILYKSYSMKIYPDDLLYITRILFQEYMSEYLTLEEYLEIFKILRNKELI